MDEKQKESLTGCAIYGGIALALLGGVVTFALFTGGALAYMRQGDPSLWIMRGIGPLMILAGLLTTGIALLYGIQEGKRTTSGKGEAYVDPGARVLAKYAYDREGDMIVDEWLFDEREDVKFYVKLELSGGAVREFMCRREVYGQCGEGMVGAATWDGRWLGSFVPQIGGGHATPWNPNA